MPKLLNYRWEHCWSKTTSCFPKAMLVKRRCKHEHKSKTVVQATLNMTIPHHLVCTQVVCRSFGVRMARASMTRLYKRVGTEDTGLSRTFESPLSHC